MRLGTHVVVLLLIVLGQSRVRGSEISFRAQGTLEPAEPFFRPTNPQSDDTRLVPGRGLVRLSGDGPDQLVQAAEVMAELFQARRQMVGFRVFGLSLQALNQRVQRLGVV